MSESKEFWVILPGGTVVAHSDVDSVRVEEFSGNLVLMRGDVLVARYSQWVGCGEGGNFHVTQEGVR